MGWLSDFLATRGWLPPARVERAPEHDRGWMPPYWRLYYGGSSVVVCEDTRSWWQEAAASATP